MLWFEQAYGQSDNVNVEEVFHEPSTQATTETTDTTDTTSSSTDTAIVSDHRVKTTKSSQLISIKFR